MASGRPDPLCIFVYQKSVSRVSGIKKQISLDQHHLSWIQSLASWSVAETSVADGLGFCYWAGRCSLIYIFSPEFPFLAPCHRTLMKEKLKLGPMSRSKGLVGKFVIPSGKFSPWDKCIVKKTTIHHSKERFDLCPPFQIPQCHSDHVPTHLALPNYRSHHKQGCPQASPGSEGLGQGHTTGALSIICSLCVQPVNRCLAINNQDIEDV